MKNDVTSSFDIPELENLYIMKKEDIDKFAECAALAYQEYPLFKYLTKNKLDKETIKNIVLASVKSMRSQMLGISTSKEANAIAIFAPPNYKGSKTVPFLLEGGLKLLSNADLAIFYRLLNYENFAMKLKKQYTDHQCWYLYNVTVKPEYQHQGLGSKLLRPMFQYLDRNAQDCYLETHKEENVQLYEHLGFDLIDVSNIPKTDVTQYSMLRKVKVKSRYY